MDWTQCLTIIGTNIGLGLWLFLITRKDIQLMDKNHREDIQYMDAKWEHMDAKWERLFSLFLELKSKQRQIFETEKIFMNNNPAIFEDYKIRRHFDEKTETWFFSVVDIVAALTGSKNPRDYWFKMKIRVETEDGAELSTICRQLNPTSAVNRRTKKSVSLKMLILQKPVSLK